MKKHVFILAAALLVSSGMSTAFDLPIGGFGKSSSGDSGGIDGLVSQQGGLMKSMGDTLSRMLSSQSLILDAMGDKGKAQQLKDMSDNLAKGNVAGDGLKTAMSTSEAANDEIKEKSEQSQLVDAGSKAKYQKGVGQYALGVVSLHQVAIDGQKFISGASSAIQGNPMAISKLSDGISVAKNIPGLVTSVGTTTKLLFSYGQKNGVDLKKAQSEMGDS